MTDSERQIEKLDLHLTISARRTLQAAARTSNRSLSEFVLESALARAEEILLDRRRFRLDSEQWAELQAALHAPTEPAPRLEQLLGEPSVFERSAGDKSR